MSQFIRFLFMSLLLLTLLSCAAGHQDFIDLRNKLDVGKEVFFEKFPHKFSRAGQHIRGDYVVGGYGLTHIDSNAQGQLIYHVFVQEILPNTPMEKEWVGKCLIYHVVDPNTKIVLSWGFDVGGNPLSCRTFN